VRTLRRKHSFHPPRSAKSMVSAPASIDEARSQVQDSVDHFNHVRLHSAIRYLAPSDKLNGMGPLIFEVSPATRTAPPSPSGLASMQAEKHPSRHDAAIRMAGCLHSFANLRAEKFQFPVNRDTEWRSFDSDAFYRGASLFFCDNQQPCHSHRTTVDQCLFQATLTTQMLFVSGEFRGMALQPRGMRSYMTRIDCSSSGTTSV
jgi:hypothetical protein